MTQRMRILPAMAVGLLAACGGGSDGDGGGGGAAPTATATISTQNAPEITGAVLDAATEAGDLGDLGGFAAPNNIATVQAPASAIGPTAEVQVGPEVIPCGTSGNISFEGDIEDPNTLTAGDSFTFSFNNCDEGDGDLLTGSFEFLIRAFSGDFVNGLFQLTIDMTVNDLRFGDTGDLGHRRWRL